MVVRAGQLRLTVKLQRRTDSGSRDEANRIVWTWADIYTTNAEVTDLNGRELELARTIEGSVTSRVIVRQPPPAITIGLQDRWYVSRDGRTLNIGYVKTDQDYRMVETLCGETVNGS